MVAPIDRKELLNEAVHDHMVNEQLRRSKVLHGVAGPPPPNEPPASTLISQHIDFNAQSTEEQIKRQVQTQCLRMWTASAAFRTDITTFIFVICWRLVGRNECTIEYHRC